jgi:hypothetical protein
MKTTNKKENSMMVKSPSKTKTKTNIKSTEHHIRKRAYEIFLHRAEDAGNETTDWSQAEYEIA